MAEALITRRGSSGEEFKYYSGTFSRNTGGTITVPEDVEIENIKTLIVSGEHSSRSYSLVYDFSEFYDENRVYITHRSAEGENVGATYSYFANVDFSAKTISIDLSGVSSKQPDNAPVYVIAYV